VRRIVETGSGTLGAIGVGLTIAIAIWLWRFHRAKKATADGPPPA
jgi:hypothetical protein